MKFIQVVIILLLIFLTGGCSSGQISFDDGESLQERTAKTSIDGTERVYDKEFAKDFYEVYLEVVGNTQTLYEGIYLISEESWETNEEERELKNRLSVEAEGVRFALKRLKLSSASSPIEIEAEELLTGYIKEVEGLASHLTSYYSDYKNNDIHLDNARQALKHLGIVEEKIKEIEVKIVSDSV